MIDKKRQLEINSGFCADNVAYCVTVFNIIAQNNCFEKIAEIIKCLINNNELFFGFYRTDGLTLTKQEFQMCESLLSDYFKKNGEYREIIETRTGRSGKTKTYKGVLSVAKVSVNDELYENLQWILQYYLETAFFAPDASHIDFNEFEKIYGNYMKKPDFDCIKNGYTDFLFSYFDSRHFSVSFDPKKVNVDYVLGIIKRIIHTAQLNED